MRARRTRARRARCDRHGPARGLGEQLHFPEWFGQNWDALADCLTDFSWREAEGYVLVLEQLGDFRAAGDDDFDTLIEILSDASASWGVMGIPFWAFLVIEA